MSAAAAAASGGVEEIGDFMEEKLRVVKMLGEGLMSMKRKIKQKSIEIFENILKQRREEGESDDEEEGESDDEEEGESDDELVEQPMSSGVEADVTRTKKFIYLTRDRRRDKEDRNSRRSECILQESNEILYKSIIWRRSGRN